MHSKQMDRSPMDSKSTILKTLLSLFCGLGAGCSESEHEMRGGKQREVEEEAPCEELRVYLGRKPGMREKANDYEVQTGILEFNFQCLSKPGTLGVSWEAGALNAQPDLAGQSGKRGPQYKLWDQGDGGWGRPERERGHSLQFHAFHRPCSVPENSLGHYCPMARLTPEPYCIHLFIFCSG